MEKLLMISADTHACMPATRYAEWLEPQYREAAAPLVEVNRKIEDLLWETAVDAETEAYIDPRGVLKAGGRQGLWDPARRLAELEGEGFVAEVLFPGDRASVGPFFSNLSPSCSAEHRAAGVRAYNRWLAEFCQYAPGRMKGVIQTEPWPDMAACLAQITEARRGGLDIVSMPRFAGLYENQPPVSDPAWDPYWRLCVESDMTVAVHLGQNHPQGASLIAFDGLDVRTKGHPDVAVKGEISYDPGRAPLWQMIYAGVFDRFPELRVTFSELRFEWLAPTLAHLERRFDRARFAEMGLKVPKLRPSEYWRRHCGIAGQIRPYEMSLRHQIGVDTMMFGTDFPHSEGSWPNSEDWMRLSFEGVADDEVRKILGENAARFYRFDVDMLRPHAARVGRVLADLRPQGAPDPRIVENLHWRANFLGQLYRYDPEMMDAIIDQDQRFAGAFA